jgi:hypothetical protein
MIFISAAGTSFYNGIGGEAALRQFLVTHAQ